ncbi:MAG: hypothetical protein JRH19_22020 [Deltaproteobacteria bacterium]|nr:hypothetical protein [Deltaproteobacteria bacterium]
MAIALAAREARSCELCRERAAALSPYSVQGAHAAAGGLSAALRDAVHRLSTDPGRVGERWYRDLLAAGHEPESVVELVAVVSIVSLADTLAKGLGAQLRSVPEPVAGAPTRERPPGLELSCAWVPTVDPERAEGSVRVHYDFAKAQTGIVFHVARALSAVPEAANQFFAAFGASYSIAGETAGALTRPQVELLAASTSAENDCFY